MKPRKTWTYSYWKNFLVPFNFLVKLILDFKGNSTTTRDAFFKKNLLVDESQKYVICEYNNNIN